VEGAVLALRQLTPGVRLSSCPQCQGWRALRVRPSPSPPVPHCPQCLAQAKTQLSVGKFPSDTLSGLLGVYPDHQIICFDESQCTSPLDMITLLVRSFIDRVMIQNAVLSANCFCARSRLNSEMPRSSSYDKLGPVAMQ